ncbi:amidohydrolase [Anaerobaca lacustris]|uniref:Amidohydrolase n=1 Tax=Anaerobaca lacustris TaxID=3044600 RepID=A0AAW6TZK0_9BACT|nr:amidohydrolase [Sedimentisphaerales bacterium M17dextr]
MKYALVICLCLGAALHAAGPELIVRNARIATVDPAFSIREAMAVEDGRIVAVGGNDEVLRLRTAATEVLDLGGRMVMPGLIDSHVHACGAAMTEFDHPIPDMESVQDVLDYVRARAEALDDGQWIVLQQVFITRLRERRYPTRAELDLGAPKNPCVFRTGPDASVNTLALQRSGIDRDFRVTDGGPGHIETDPQTGEPTGILRGCTRYLKIRQPGREATERDRYDRLLALFGDYSSVGITSICDGSAGQGNLDLYQKMLDEGELPLRVASQYYVGTIGPIEDIEQAIRKVAEHPLRRGGPMLRVIGVKVFLDGGMLTGSAYMSRPWGVSAIYAIDDPDYRGVLFIPKDRLRAMVRAATESGLQFTAHTVGDGAVETLVGVYDELSRIMPIRDRRHAITHSNFMSPETVQKVVDLGVIPLVQPAWLYLDARTLFEHFGYERLRWFQPWRSILDAGGIVAGGSDHMQKIGSLRSINPYDPFLGIWTTLTRRARWYDGQLHPEEALTREQAIRIYTIHGATALFLDDHVGSLEKGKRADFIVLDTDLLTCPVDAIRRARVLRTYCDGRLVFDRQSLRAEAGGTVEK